MPKDMTSSARVRYVVPLIPALLSLVLQGCGGDQAPLQEEGSADASRAARTTTSTGRVSAPTTGGCWALAESTLSLWAVRHFGVSPEVHWQDGG